MMLGAGSPKRSLPWHQWWIVVALVLFVVTVVAVSHCSRGDFFVQEVGTPGYRASQYIEVKVQGAVEAPGTYVLPKGADLTRLLELSRPRIEADLKSLLRHSQLRQGQVIKVRKRPFITVYLEGAVEQPGAIRVPKGITMQDLLVQCPLKENADSSLFKKKRVLKNKETIFIPFVSRK